MHSNFSSRKLPYLHMTTRKCVRIRIRFESCRPLTIRSLNIILNNLNLGGAPNASFNSIWGPTVCEPSRVSMVHGCDVTNRVSTLGEAEKYCVPGKPKQIF